MTPLVALLDPKAIEKEASSPRAQAKRSLAMRRASIKALPRTESTREAAKIVDKLIKSPKENIAEALDRISFLIKGEQTHKKAAWEMLFGTP